MTLLKSGGHSRHEDLSPQQASARETFEVAGMGRDSPRDPNRSVRPDIFRGKRVGDAKPRTVPIMSNGFTPVTQAAARDRRRRRSEAEATSFGSPAIFAVRVGNAFGWESRKYGGLIVGRSEDVFDTPDLAREAGERASMASDM